jgi:hypothetical protein
VSEDKRMSLADLKDWNSKNTYEALAQGNMMLLPELSLNKKPCTTKERGVLGEVTNKMSSRSQSTFAYNSKTSKDPSNQQNISVQRENKPINHKTTIEKNNNILIIEINTFRLLFKIHEKLKKYSG